MRMGVHIMRFDQPPRPGGLRQELADAADAAEAAGLSWLDVMDHWFEIEGVGDGVKAPMLEAYTTLGYLAGRTSSVQLGALVTGVTYRYPGLLAKIIATLDVLSGGRATLGIGAAWYEREHRGLGVPFPPLAERFERLEETLAICRQMWDPTNNGPFEGKHYQLAETVCVPAPVSQPHPEVLIGGSGERKTLRLVAQYADACNLFASSPDEIAHKLDVLRGHCADVGRDPAEIRVTMLHGAEQLLQGDVDGFVADMSAYAALGVETIIVRTPPGIGVPEWVGTALAPVVPRLAELG